MNLNELFPVQKKLDNEIVENHKLQGQDLLEKKKVALLAELYECVNEARFFKFWSKDQKARTEVKCHACEGRGFFDFATPFSNEHFTEGCGYCEGTGIQEKNPLLEEYIDTIHFAISICLEFDYTEHKYTDTEAQDLNGIVLGLTNIVTILGRDMLRMPNDMMSIFFNHIIKLGYQFGFTEEMVIAAYYDKNKINHARQENGY